MKESFPSAIEAVANFADIFHAKRLKHYYKTKVINTVIDVGSHKGEFINLVCDDQIPIYSFEPQSSVRKLLKDNTKNKNIVEYYDYALSSYDGTIDLFLNKLTSTTSTIAPNEKSYWVRFKGLILGGELLSGKESVRTTTLDKLFSGKLEGFVTLSVSLKHKSMPQWAVLETHTTMPWLKPSTVFTRPKLSVVENRGRILKRSNTQRWNGLIGSIIVDC